MGGLRRSVTGDKPVAPKAYIKLSPVVSENGVNTISCVVHLCTLYLTETASTIRQADENALVAFHQYNAQTDGTKGEI